MDRGGKMSVRGRWAKAAAGLGLLLAAGAVQAAVTVDAVTLNGAASVTVGGGATIAAAVTVTTDATNWRSTGWRISTTAPGGTTCVNHADHDGDSQTFAESFNITAPTTAGTYNAYFVAGSNDSCGGTTTLYTMNNAVTVAPTVSSINRASFDPTSSFKSVAWTVTFSMSVTGVDAADFSLVQTGGTTGASIASVTGAGTTWTVTANTGTGTAAGSLRLDLVDNDSIVSGTTPLGGAGSGNGNFSGQSYTLLPPACTGDADIVFCDDFERSNSGAVGNGWTITAGGGSDCGGQAGNSGCAGIDSDIPPFNVYANPRANPTRSMFTRWDVVTVQSPTINLAGLSGAQFSFWMRRGGDAFSEYPEATGENYLVQYRDNTGTWKILAQYPSGVMEGQVFTPTIELPADALHANFALRFYQPSGSGDGCGWLGCTGYGGAPNVLGYDYWHLDNVIIRNRPAPSFTGAFCDNFEGGLGRWSVSAEGAPGGATIGDASLGTLTYSSATHSLDLRWGYVVASTFKTDLTGVTGNISYWVRSGTTSDRDPDSGEDLVVEYLNSSGSWTALATYLGSAAAGTSYNASIAIPADAKHANFRLRFRHLNASGYDRDYWHVDDVCVGDLVPTADLAITKTRTGALVPGTNASYAINVTNNGPGTLSGSVQVTDTLPASLGYLAGSGSGWTCSANGQDVTCNWSGTLAAGAVAPTLTLTVAVASGASGTITNSATVSGTVVDNVAANNTGSDTATIYIPSYVFTDRACPNGVAIGAGATPCNLVGWSPRTAGQALGGVYITALNASGIPTQLSGSTSTTVNFQFALSCLDPTANAGVQASFSAAGSALPLCAANGAVPTSWSTGANQVFPAGSPSTGPFSFNYDDVGQVELYVRNSAATTQIGQSGAFVVKPAGFVLSSIVRTSDGFANPGATTATGTLFVKAGEAFSVTVKAVNAAGNATPNYGKEVAPEGVRLASSLVGGLGLTSNPALTNATGFGAFASGQATGTSFGWGEVGIITLTPSVGDGDYLGAGDATGTASGNVGRFIPHHFDTEVSHGCTAGSYTYSGQTFPLKVTAKNAAGGTTANYAGSFAKTHTYADANGAVGSFNPATLAATGFAAGVGDLTSPAVVSFSYTNKLTAPTTLKVRVTDGEASSATGSEGTTALRSGRLRMQNAFGAETLALPLPLTAEYYTAGGWRQNTADSCTTLVVPALSNYKRNLDAGETTPTLAHVPLRNGNAGLRLSAPGTGNTGSVTVTTTAPGYLQYDWDNNGTHDNNPSAVAVFGINRSDFIFLREAY